MALALNKGDRVTFSTISQIEWWVNPKEEGLSEDFLRHTTDLVCDIPFGNREFGSGKLEAKKERLYFSMEHEVNGKLKHDLDVYVKLTPAQVIIVSS